MTSTGSDFPWAPGIDVTRPSVARTYDLMLGGKDNYASDRALYKKILEVAPEASVWARENRRWLGRVVTWLARDAGITQFVDLGSGLPTRQNTHQLAQGYNPGATVVYVDNDPSVIAYGRALLVENGHTKFVAGDLTRPAEILAAPEIAPLVESGEPVGLILALVLHHVEDDGLARTAVGSYLDALPAGSYLAISHAVNPRDGSPQAELATEVEERFRTSFQSLRFRTPAEVTELLGELELVEPCMVPLFDWHTPGDRRGRETTDEVSTAMSQMIYGGLARKR